MRDLWHIKGQAFAIATVLACGVAIVIMTFGAMRSLQATRDAYYDRYRFADVFCQLKRAPLRVARQIAEIPGVAAVETRITHYAALDIAELPRPAAAFLLSLPDRGEPTLNDIALREGRLPAVGRDELIMSENMARALGYTLGRKVSVLLGGRKRAFTIVGIANSPEFVYVLAPGQLMPDDKAFSALWLNRSVMEAAYDLNGAFNDVSVRLAPGASLPDVIQRLDQVLARYGGTAAYGREDQTSHAFVSQELNQLEMIAVVIPPIFLGVAAFLMHMVMSRLIDTERESIGLLKSFGYSNWEVGTHYLKLAIIVAVLGDAIGLTAGVWLGRWMTQMYQGYFRFPFLEYQFDRTVFFVALLVSLGAAIGGTLTAVMRAVRLAPATAMLPAAPAIYRRTFVDRLGLDRYISMPTQMILRNLERWPFRALLTCSGMAMAVMLLVGLFFFFDALDELVDNVYFRANRQDMVIGLLEQRSDRARFDIARLPGVRGAESVLEVPARLSNGHLMQRLALTGLEQGGGLRAFFDSAGRPFTLPDDGIILSDKLASLLSMHLGESVHVEILEGARRETFLSVAAIVSENVGLSAYMNKRRLEALTGQPSSLTSVRALLDGALEAELLQRLKEIPTVSTISTRAQAISSLRDTLERSVTIVVDFYVALGAIIAFGVVYNAARISLSERGRELASLRVLGFTRAEVTYILLGELALLVVAALPVGCVLGYWLAWFMSHTMETKLFRIPFVVFPATYGIAITIALLSAGASAIPVAWRINRLDLISVLKTRE